MRSRKKLQAVTDCELISPAQLMETVVDNTPEEVTFQRRLRHTTSIRSQREEPLVCQLSYQPSLRSNRFSNLASLAERTLPPALFAREGTEGSEGGEESLSGQLSKMTTAVEQKKRGTCKLIFEKNNILEGIVRSQKIKKLQNTFLRKIQRTSTTQPPVAYDQFADWSDNSFLHFRGIELHPLVDSLLNLLSVLQIISLLVVYSLSLIYENLLRSSLALSTLQLASLVFYVAEMVVNLVSVKSEAGKKVQHLRQIFKFYLGRSFWVDLVSVLILAVDIGSAQDGVIGYLRLFIIFKLPQCLDKIEKIEVYFIRNVYNEQYWELAKVFIVNFCFAHIIALVLAAMAGLSPQANWMTAKGIEGQSWVEQYIWSYYWANNIMLTVGFGDMVASNYQEAVCLIFIETFSCIVMAYNVNCVGSIISSIRAQNQRRSKNFKIFKKLTGQNFVSEELAFKINNYIEESSNLRKKFNHEEDQGFLAELPDTLRLTYLREANKEVLKELVFFRGLLDRTLSNFAERIETRISHPQEIIRAIDDDFNLIILRKGRIGYVCKRVGCGFNQEIADLIRVREGDSPFLTSLDFISKQRPLYQIKSLQFSVLFTLSYDRFIQIFRQSDMDYQLFCFLRDKIRNIPDEFEVNPCEFCPSYNHFKFTCPRLHYVPYEQHVIDKQLYREKVGFNTRNPLIRAKISTFSPMQYYKKVKDYRAKLQIVQMKPSIVMPLATVASDSKTLGNERSQLLTNEMLESVLDSKTREIIQKEFVRLDKRKAFDDDVWIINTDVMTNFNSYFSQDNPHSLSEKFSPESRLQRKMDRQKLKLQVERTESNMGKERTESYQSYLQQCSAASSRLLAD